ncbi:site-specific integrase [Amycolatopsis sp. NPDC004368]
MANYRGHDGKTSQYERSATSETKAVHALKEHFAKLSGTKVKLGNGSRFKDAIPLYLDKVKQLERSPSTYDRYERRLRVHVEPALGNLLLRECDTPRLEDFFNSLQKNGLAAATRRGIRTVVSGVMDLAVMSRVFEVNPVRGISDISGKAVRPSAAFDAEELGAFLAKVDADKKAIKYDLPDYLRCLFGTGARFGEALALRWCDINLGHTPSTAEAWGKKKILPPRSVWFNGTIIWVKGQGAVRKETKTESGNRVVSLPDFLFTMLLVRKPTGVLDTAPVFPSGRLGYRHPSNVQRSIRALRARIGYDDFRTHGGRKTVVTALDAAGHSAREAADTVGHKNVSMTQDVYMDRGRINPAAAASVDAFVRGAMKPVGPVDPEGQRETA